MLITGIIFYLIGMVIFFIGTHTTVQNNRNQAFYKKVLIWSLPLIALGVFVMMIAKLMEH